MPNIPRKTALDTNVSNARWYTLPRGQGFATNVHADRMIVFIYVRSGYRLQFTPDRLYVEGRFDVTETFATLQAAQEAVPRHIEWGRELVRAAWEAASQRLAEARRRQILGDEPYPPREDLCDGLLL